MLKSITILPEPENWPQLETFTGLGSDAIVFGQPIGQWVRDTRRQVLDVDSDDGPVVITGHQASFWHPGILARYEATEAYARNLHAATLVELLVDQDTNDPLTVTLPSFIDGRLDISTFRLAAPDVRTPGEGDTPTGMQPTVSVHVDDHVQVPAEHCDVAIIEQSRYLLSRMRRAIARHRDEPNLAMQIAMAHADLRGVAYGQSQDHSLRRELLPVSRLTRTLFWQALIQHMSNDSEKMHRSYNSAASRFPSAGIACLGVDPHRGLELPLWTIDPSTGRRQRAWASDLKLYDPNRFLPRALLTTGVVRLVVADVMVHGLGAAEYERVTDAFLTGWLGVEPAPYTTVSATIVPDVPPAYYTWDAYRQLQQRARWMRYNLHRMPWVGADYARRYEDALRVVNTLPQRSDARRRASGELRRIRSEGINVYARRLSQFDAEVNRASNHLVSSSYLAHRTSPFPAYEQADIHELRRSVWGAFSSEPPERRENECLPQRAKASLCRSCTSDE